MKAPAPIVIAATLSAVVLVIGYLMYGVFTGSGIGNAGLDLEEHSATGNILPCSGQGEVQSTYSQLGDKFSVVGQLASKESGGILVRGPTGYIRMTLADGSVIEGPYVSGQPIQVAGILDGDGNAQATYVRPACEGDFVAAPATPAPAQTAPEPTPAITAPPVAPDSGGGADTGTGHGRGKEKRRR